MSAGLRPIDGALLTRPETMPDVGEPPQLRWIEIARLAVDDRYQRPILGAGLSNVRRIAEGFRWSKFAPVIVAPAGGGKYAIVDGQHRTTAAAILGFDAVPCQVITADEAAQAAAFKSINGQVTKVHRLSLHRAALAAGDAGAVELNRVAEAAGVRILPYPIPSESMQPGDTIALGGIAGGVRRYGAETTITALMCVTETENNKPGALSGPVINALCTLLGGNARWRDAGGGLLAAFDAIDLEEELEEARVTRRPKLTAVWEILSDRLALKLTRLLPPARGGT